MTKVVKIKKWVWGITAVALVFFCSHVQAQLPKRYPVQANTFITPPYSPYMSDYLNASDKLVVNLLLQDFNAFDIEVRLALTIESQGLKLQTSPAAQLPILRLNGGEPVRLSYDELSPYFDAANLLFQGINRVGYEQTGGLLPEGYYSFCFDVYEVRTGAKLTSSSSSCARIFLVLNDPPLINVPLHQAVVSTQEPQNLVFQWTPRHKGSPNAAFQTEYIFELIELPPNYQGVPQAAVFSAVPFFTATTRDAMLVMGPADPQLLEGRMYACRVRAVAEGNISEASLFKNNGYSEIHVFTYEGKCELPFDVTATSTGRDKVTVRWSASPNTNISTAYSILYREVDNPSAEWFTANAAINMQSIVLDGLKKGNTYEFKIGTKISNCFTPTQSITISSVIPTATITCGAPDQFALPKSGTEVQLKSGDTFKAGDFSFYVTQGTQASGKGVLLALPWLQQLVHGSKPVGIEVSFENIVVNEDYMLTAGEIATVTDESMSNIIDIPKPSPSTTANHRYYTTEAGIIKLSAGIVVNEPYQITPDSINGKIKITYFQNNVPATIIINNNFSKTTTIEDSKGNTYTVDKDGKVSEQGGGNNSPTVPDQPTPVTQNNLPLNTQDAEVVFESYGNQHYGFDNTKASVGNDEAAWKSMQVNGLLDKVVVEVTIHNTQEVSKGRIEFTVGKTKLGTLETDGNKQVLTIPAMTVAGEHVLYAYYTRGANEKDTVRIGKLKIIAYTPVEKTVVFVTLNKIFGDVVRMEKDSTASYLNKLYAQSVVKWNVEIDNILEDKRDELKAIFDEEGGRKIRMPNAHDTTGYTSQMQALIDLYKSKINNYSENKYYLFIGRLASDDNALGYFPLPDNRANFGFIFNPKDNVIAHELGHGAFHYKHDGNIEGNLMHYPYSYNGSQLTRVEKKLVYTETKAQWDGVRNIRVVDGSETVESNSSAKTNLTGVPMNTGATGKKYYTFMSPFGLPISFETGKFSQPGFVFDDDADLGKIDRKDFSLNKFFERLMPNVDYSGVLYGSLVSFMYDGLLYKARMNHGAVIGGFSGYYPVNKGDEPYIDSGTKDLLARYVNQKEIIRQIIGTVCFENQSFVIKIKQIVISDNKLFDCEKFYEALNNHTNISSDGINGYTGRFMAQSAAVIKPDHSAIFKAIDDASLVKTSPYVNASNKKLCPIANGFYKHFASKINCSNNKLQLLQNVTNLINYSPMYFVDYMLEKGYREGGKISLSKIPDLKNFAVDYTKFVVEQYARDNPFLERVKRNVCEMADELNSIANVKKGLSGQVQWKELLTASIDSLLKGMLYRIKPKSITDPRDAIKWGIINATRKQLSKILSDFLSEKIEKQVIEKLSAKMQVVLPEVGQATAVMSVAGDILCGLLGSIQVYRSYYDESFMTTKFAEEYRNGVDNILSLFDKTTYERIVNEVQGDIVNKFETYSKNLVIKKTYGPIECDLLINKVDAMISEIYGQVKDVKSYRSSILAQKNRADRVFAFSGIVIQKLRDLALDKAGVDLSNYHLLRAASSLQEMGIVASNEQAFLMLTRGQTLDQTKLQIKVRNELNTYADLKSYNGALVIDFNKAVSKPDANGNNPKASGEVLIATIKNPIFKRNPNINTICRGGELNIYQKDNEIVIRQSKCFVAGTKIATVQGLTNIENIKTGDSVAAYNETTKTTVSKRVAKTFVRKAETLVKIFTGKDTIQATPEHPFYVPTKGWLYASALHKGIKVLTLAGALLTIDSVAVKDTSATVYNFEVEELHNYYVGASKILVHNVDGYDEEAVNNDRLEAIKTKYKNDKSFDLIRSLLSEYQNDVKKKIRVELFIVELADKQTSVLQSEILKSPKKYFKSWEVLVDAGDDKLRTNIYQLGRIKSLLEMEIWPKKYSTDKAKHEYLVDALKKKTNEERLAILVEISNCKTNKDLLKLIGRDAILKVEKKELSITTTDNIVQEIFKKHKNGTYSTEVAAEAMSDYVFVEKNKMKDITVKPIGEHKNHQFDRIYGIFHEKNGKTEIIEIIVVEVKGTTSSNPLNSLLSGDRKSGNQQGTVAYFKEIIEDYKEQAKSQPQPKLSGLVEEIEEAINNKKIRYVSLVQRFDTDKLGNTEIYEFDMGDMGIDTPLHL
jgi:Pretoxin HINT domain/Fibronectin type III domain